MNVLLLTATFPPEIRSAALLMGELAETLASHGHDVTVITGPIEGTAPTLVRVIEQHRNLRVIRVPAFAIHRLHLPAVVRGMGQLLNSLTYLLSAFGVKKIDVSLAYSPPLALGLVGAALASVRGIPHVLNVQDLVPQYAIDLGIIRNRGLIRVLKAIEKSVYRHVQAITVHSRGNAEYMLAEGVPQAKVTVVPNWVDTSTIRPSSRDTAYRRNHGLQDKFVVLFAGMLGFAQDLDTVVEAGVHLRERPDVVTLIVGEGVEKERLQQEAAALGLDNVRFMPAVSSAEYPEVVATADLCLATLQKSLKCPVVPSKILGYMAAGRPIVASFPEDGDAPRVIRQAGCGVCVPPGEPQRLAQAILEAASDADARSAWGEAGRKYVEANHDRNRVVAQYEALFEALTGKRHTSRPEAEPLRRPA